MRILFRATFSVLILCVAAAADDVRVIVGFKGQPDAEVVRKLGGGQMRNLLAGRTMVAVVPANAVSRLREDENVAYVEEDGIAATMAKPPGTATQPSEQTPWGVTKVNAPLTGNVGAGIKVAIIDTGVDLAHPDLGAKIVSSGYDFANDDDDATDDHWHGTHVAGIAAADTDNAVGIAGVARDCRILPVKVTDANGDGYYSWIIDGIIWATDQGADVINLSLGGDVPDSFLEDACTYAHDHGVVIAAASGNDGGSVLYPAAYDDTVLAAAASDYNDAIASFSNFGPEVDVAAPGVWVLGPAPQAYVGPDELPYVFASGTSAAAPHVAGLAALIRSIKPDLTAGEIMMIVRYTADDIDRTAFPGRDDHAGYGRINMRRAIVPYILD